MHSTHTVHELRTLATMLQMSQTQEALSSDTQIVASAFALGDSLDSPSGYCERKLYDISKEVKLLQARLHFLAAEEERGKIAKRRARNRLQPMLRLPDEVLGTIVLFSMMPCDATIWHAPAPAVSNRLRNCALKESKIWRRVFIMPDTKEDELITWLSRSRSAQLDIHFKLPTVLESSQFSQDEHFDCMQSLLTPHSRRIHSLVYDLGVQTDVLFPLSITVPSLRNLSLTWNHAPYLTPLPVVFQHNAPSGLCELHLESHGLAPNQVVLNDFDASKLVSLTVGEWVTVRSIWTTLSRSKLLRRLEWQGNEEQDGVVPLDA